MCSACTRVSGGGGGRGGVSHLETTVLDVVELQAKGLYAAYDSPLMADQTDSNTPDVPEGQTANIHSCVNHKCRAGEGRHGLNKLKRWKHISCDSLKICFTSRNLT